MLKSSVRTYEVLVMRMEEWTQVGFESKIKFDGTPCAVKIACTVRRRGKDGGFRVF
jgi:succinyl-CoA synthetase beta subunit